MRKLSLFVLIFFVCLSCIRSKKHTILFQSESKGFPYLIYNGKMGTVSIGDGIDSTLHNLQLWFDVNHDSIPVCEGCDEYSPIYHIYYSTENRYVFSIETGTDDNNKEKVSRLTTSFELFKTENHEIQIGMSVKDLKREYEIIDVDNSGETGIHIIVKGFNGSFGVELPQSDEWVKYTPTSIPDTLMIKEIIVT